MMTLKNTIAICVVALMICNACNLAQKNNNTNNTNTIDTVLLAKGEIAFEKNCATCHHFRQNAIGPQLNGITDKVSSNWLHSFIKNPAAMIASGDKHATELHQQFKAMMPSFTSMGDEEIDAIIVFLGTKKAAAAIAAKTDATAIKNPYPDSISFSNIEINLDSFIQIPASASAAPMARITKLSFQPGTNNLFVVDLRSKLYKIINNKPQVYMDMEKLKPHFIHKPGLGSGFGSFAFHPQFMKNGLLYTTHTEAPASGMADFKYADSIKVTLQWVLTEWKATDAKAAVFEGTSREILRINMVKDIHGVQEIIFNPLATPASKDYGMLYIGVGDGGSVENGFPMLPGNTKHIWGSVLRINPQGNNSKNQRYGIPADNPFAQADDTTLVKEIYCYGFRNPHRITWTKDNKMLVFNIGQSNIESIYSVKSGGDYGWPFREGNFSVDFSGDISKIHTLPSNDSMYHFIYPVAVYDHDEGKAISGGFEYNGAISSLKGKIIFGDIPSGRIFYIENKDVQQGKLAVVKELHIAVNNNPTTLAKACGNARVELRLGEDAKGALYILTKADGKIYKLANAVVKN
jgi:glucose/arabinose dehydrogenase/cytochrome c2